MRGAEIRVEVSHGQLTVIKVSGEIDLSNVGSFRSAIAGVLPSCALGFVIDLTTTNFIDSTGIEVIFRARRELGDSGGIVLVTSNPNIKRVFDLVQICAVPGLSMCDDIATTDCYQKWEVKAVASRMCMELPRGKPR